MVCKRKNPAICLAAVICLILALSVASGAGAAGNNKLNALYVSVSWCEDGAEMPVGAVAWYKLSDKEYALFMPGGTDWAETRVWFDGIEEIRIGDDVYHSGDRIQGLEKNGSYTLTAGKKTYTLTVKQGSAIGAVFVETATGSMKKIDAGTRYKEEGGRLTFVNPDGTLAYQGDLEHFKLRGNTSTTLNKKNYGFKLAGAEDFMGFGKARRWVLIGNGRDLTLLRNRICLAMAQYAGIRYTPDAAPVDLYLNHQYNGTYLMAEKIEINENRVDIYDLEKANREANPDKPLDEYKRVGEVNAARQGKYKAYALPNDPEDITGGYILDFESDRSRYGNAQSAFTTDRSKVYLLREPEHASAAEAEYAAAYMQGFEDAIFARDGVNPDTGRHYSEYVDFDSLVRKFMLEEISMNVDGNGSSQFYYKPADAESTVFIAGPAWDYDATFASYSAKEAQDAFLNPSRLLLTVTNNSNHYWPQLYAKKEFKEAVCRTWDSTYAHAMKILLGQEEDPEGRLLPLEAYAEEIRESAEMNFMRWPISKNGGKNVKRTGSTWEENLSYLGGILGKRSAALERIWGGRTAEREEQDASSETKTKLTPLPMDDITAFGPLPDPSKVTWGKHEFSTENTFNECVYEDESIRVVLWNEWVGKALYSTAHIWISDPSQFRTALHQDRLAMNHYVWVTSRAKNAVVGVGGEHLLFDSNRSTYVVRMENRLREGKGIRGRDTLITDENGDFHIFQGYNASMIEEVEADGHTVVNLFNFGPAYVIDGELIHPAGEMFRYLVGGPMGREPRCAIGQIGPLEYVVVTVDGRNNKAPTPDSGHQYSAGATMGEVAEYMYSQGCYQAYNLDGGASASTYFFGAENADGKYSYPYTNRAVSDIIYFATLVDAGAGPTAEE